MILAILQLLVAIAVIILILIQEKAEGAGALFGGGEGGYHTRRGVEKLTHNLTIILVVAFGILALLNLFL